MTAAEAMKAGSAWRNAPVEGGINPSSRAVSRMEQRMLVLMLFVEL